MNDEGEGGRGMDIGDLPKERGRTGKGVSEVVRGCRGVVGAAQRGVDDSSACLKCISQ